MMAAANCGWCDCALPEPEHDAWLIGADRAGRECPCCTRCARVYKPVIVRIEKEP